MPHCRFRFNAPWKTKNIISLYVPVPVRGCSIFKDASSLCYNDSLEFCRKIKVPHCGTLIFLQNSRQDKNVPVEFLEYWRQKRKRSKVVEIKAPLKNRRKLLSRTALSPVRDNNFLLFFIWALLEKRTKLKSRTGTGTVQDNNFVRFFRRALNFKYYFKAGFETVYEVWDYNFLEKMKTT